MRRNVKRTGPKNRGQAPRRSCSRRLDARLEACATTAITAAAATRLYLTGSQVERDNHFQQLDDRDPLTRLAQALERTGTEQLAHDSRRPPVRPMERTRPVIIRRSPAERELESARAQLRTLNAQEDRARELRERTQRRIVEAEARLAGLGWRGRRRHGHELGRGALTGRQFLELVFEEAGHSPKIGVASRPMIRMAGLFNPLLRELNETLYQFERPFVVDASKFQGAFGPFETTPHREAVRRTVAWFRRHYRV